MQARHTLATLAAVVLSVASLGAQATPKSTMQAKPTAKAADTTHKPAATTATTAAKPATDSATKPAKHKGKAKAKPSH